MSKRARSTRGQSSTSQEVSLEEKIRRFGVFKNGVHQMHHDALTRHPIHPGDVIDWEFLASQVPIEKLVCEILLLHLSLVPLLVVGRRLALSQRKSRENVTLNGLSRAETVKASHLLREFWPSIGDGGFYVGNTKVASIRYPRVKLAHRCIATIISGRQESTNRVTEIDLYYLYCIYTQGVIFNILYWLAKYLRSVREKNLICGGMLVTRIARSFRLLTNEMMDALSVEPLPHVKEDDEAEEAVKGEAGNEGAGGSADMYRNMSQGDWQVRQARWMDQQDEHWGRLNTWIGQQEERANWIYDHTVRQF
ncbi:hypothetical protein Tco_0983651 [Tanacetum coccineum]